MAAKLDDFWLQMRIANMNVPASDNTIRLAPPLIVSYKEIDESIAIIKKVLKQYNE